MIIMFVSLKHNIHISKFIKYLQPWKKFTINIHIVHNFNFNNPFYFLTITNVNMLIFLKYLIIII